MRFLTGSPIVLPALLIFIMFGVLISGSFRVVNTIRNIQYRSTENYTWLFSQAEYELNRLRIAAEPLGLIDVSPALMRENLDVFNQAFGKGLSL